jgi:hypothetical protein
MLIYHNDRSVSINCAYPGFFTTEVTEDTEILRRFGFLGARRVYTLPLLAAGGGEDSPPFVKGFSGNKSWRSKIRGGAMDASHMRS